MSDKPIELLWEADRIMRRLKPVTFTGNTVTKLTIELINGFELFNTRHYHNYEDWSDGYRVSDGVITVEAEDLDDALIKFEKKLLETK